MLCHLCELFLTDILNDDFVNWRHVETGWYTYKHGDHATIKTGADAGCEICSLFTEVREKRIPGYSETSEKWLVHQASIDYKYEYDAQQRRIQNTERQPEKRAQWAFHLFTVLPRMSCLAFEIFHPRFPTFPTYKESPLQTLPYGVPTAPIDKNTVDLVSDWLDDCMHRHLECGPCIRAPLPTRVLNIAASGGSFDVRLQVNKGQQGFYVTLSHCWGEGSRLKLTKRNLLDFQRNIPFDELPPTFQDAVRLTASLDQQYLWIDALCILQDDQEDWRREASSMGSVFEKSVFSISALNAADSYDGLLKPRDTAQAIVDVAGSRIGIRERLPSLPEALQQSKLETRAWCLQERMLSPRILHIGPEQLYWECRTSVISETSPDDPKEIDGANFDRLFVGSGAYNTSNYNSLDHQARWLELVAGYSARDLTKRSDRLPAIAGLAEKVRRELGLGKYMHGIWLGNILPGLLWRRDLERDGQTTEQSRGEGPSPSWSWASSNGAVEYPLLAALHKHSPMPSDMAVESQDAAGSTTLWVTCHIRRGSCKVVARPSIPNEAAFRPSGSLLEDHGLPCFLDAVDEPVSKGCYCVLVGTFDKQPQHPQRRQDHLSVSFYLILERTQDHRSSLSSDSGSFGRFRRIGMGFDSVQKVERLFNNAERRLLELI